MNLAVRVVTLSGSSSALLSRLAITRSAVIVASAPSILVSPLYQPSNAYPGAGAAADPVILSSSSTSGSASCRVGV